MQVVFVCGVFIATFLLLIYALILQPLNLERRNSDLTAFIGEKNISITSTLLRGRPQRDSNISVNPTSFANGQQLSTQTSTTSLTRVEAPCPSGPILSVLDGGRLGNKIFEYAIVWSLARMLGRPGYVPQSMLTTLGEVFANLSLPAIEEIEHCHVKFGKPLHRAQLRPLENVSKRYKNQNMLLQRYIQFPEPVLRYRDLLQNELSFHPEILSEVDATVRNLGGRGKVLVGVHVRRTDFSKYLPKFFKTSLVGDEFFKEAMQWFREKFTGPLLFMIVSDDPEWCQKHLLDRDDVVIASKSPGHDLALLSLSNHTITDYGTFGYWGALMSNGHSVALDMDKNFNSVLATDKKWSFMNPGRLHRKEIK